MKGLITLSGFAFLYLVIIIIFNEVGGEPRGVQDKNIGQSDSGGKALKKNGTKDGENSSLEQDPKFGKMATDPSQKVKADEPAKHAQPAQRAAAVDSNNQNNANDSNPLADLFQIGDPTTRTALSAIYGAYKGNDQCSRKAFCMMGNYMKDMPARDLVFLIMGNYIPPEYSLYYEIFKVAVIYGQNCEVYVCIPDSALPDAASAARPSTPSAPSQKDQQPSSQQKPGAPPKKPASLDNPFDNAFPR